MSELAYNYRGDAFAPPTGATGWRVRRLRDQQRGQLDNLYGEDGLPLVVAITIDYAGLRDAVDGRAGRYRLDPVDAKRHPIRDGEAAYVTIGSALRNAGGGDLDGDTDGGAVDGDDDGLSPIDSDPGMSEAVTEPAAVVASAAVVGARRGSRQSPVPGGVATGLRLAPWATPMGTWPGLPVPTLMSGAEYLVAEALRSHSMALHVLSTALSERSAATAAGAAQMIGAAAELVRAADGAAMPMRPPPPPPPPAPAPVPPPAPAPPPPAPVLYAMPRNAMPAEDELVDDDLEDDEPVDESAPSEQDMFAKVLAIADKVQGVIAPVADVARLVMGGFGNTEALGLRNAEAPEPAAPPPAADPPPPSATLPGHLCTSHMLLIAHELGADGSRFRRLVMAMEAEARTALTTHLCALPLSEAVAEATGLLARMNGRPRDRRPEAPPPVHAAAPAQGAAHADELAGVPDDGDADARAVATPAPVDEPADEPGGDATAAPGLAAPPPSAAPVPIRPPRMPGDPPVPFVPVPSTPPLVPGPQLAMVHTSMLCASPPEDHAVNPPVGLSPAELNARFMAVAKHLTVLERAKVFALMGETPQAERDAWIARLIGLTPEEAARVIKAEIARRGG